jgi:hypothetical protein
VVERLRAQGAVLLGKTNVPLGLRDWRPTTPSMARPAIRATRAGRQADRREVAQRPCAGMSFFDIGSSLRNPAHYCDVFSHKSSLGIEPLTGHGTTAPGFAAQDIKRCWTGGPQRARPRMRSADNCWARGGRGAGLPPDFAALRAYGIERVPRGRSSQPPLCRSRCLDVSTAASSLGPIRTSVVVFVQNGVVPHVAICGAHQRP